MARKTWPLLLLRGVLGTILGILVLIWPGATLTLIAMMLGIWLLIDAIASLASAFTGGKDTAHRLLLGAMGVVSIIVGLIGLFMPGSVVGAIAILFAVWLIASGVSELSLAWKIRKEVKGEWMLVTSGLLFVIGGIALLLWPGMSLTLLGWYTIAWDILHIITAISIRSRIKDVEAALRR